MITALIVGSEPGGRDLAARHLPSRHIHTLEATTVWEATLLIRAECFEVALLTTDKNTATAAMLARSIRESSGLKNIPVLALASVDLDALARRKLYDAGVDAVVDAQRIGVLDRVIEIFLTGTEDSDGAKVPVRWALDAALLLDESGLVLDMDPRARARLGDTDCGRWLDLALPDLSETLSSEHDHEALSETWAWPGENGREHRRVIISRRAVGADVIVRGVAFLRELDAQEPVATVPVQPVAGPARARSGKEAGGEIRSPWIGSSVHRMPVVNAPEPRLTAARRRE